MSGLRRAHWVAQSRQRRVKAVTNVPPGRVESTDNEDSSGRSTPRSDAERRRERLRRAQRQVNELIREALHPYPEDLALVSKVGARRDHRGGIFAYDEPAQLRRGIEDNLRTLGVGSLPVVNLRLMREDF